MAQPRTLSEKVWDAHVVAQSEGEPDLLFIDLHLVHEVTSPQAFDGLRLTGRTVRRPDLTVATEDHNVPTSDIHLEIADPISRKQVETLRDNCAEFGITIHPMGTPDQGIVHIIGPEQGLHAAGHDHRLRRLATPPPTAPSGRWPSASAPARSSTCSPPRPCPRPRPRRSPSPSTATCPTGSTAKDVILAILGRIGTGGGIGHIAEYRGSAIEALSMEGRMTVCNMSIEAGAKAGLIAPDETTFDYLQGRAHAPTGAAWDEAVADWRTLATDDDATFDQEVRLDAAEICPHVSWGTNPGQVAPITASVPDPATIADPVERNAAERALEYMGLTAGTPMKEVGVDTVFIGSCTNGRIEDLRAAAEVAEGRRVASGSAPSSCPGSWAVKAQAEAEGLDKVFVDAGFDWRDPGCSMCLAMNPDKLAPGERCASTTNRNFEGRQGRGGRTHLVSPAVAAATAIAGHFATPDDL